MASPELSASTPPASLASHEEEQPPTATFTNIKELCQMAGQVPGQGDFLIVQNVSPAEFEEIIRLERRPFRVRRYHADRKLLFITIPTKVHEALHINIYEPFLSHLEPRRRHIWTSIGSSTFRSQGHPAGDGGEGDSAGGPKPARNHKDAWPTLVIEAGYSEPLHALRDDMRWWFIASDHQVKIVLVAKFDRPHERIIIERWEEEIPTRPGAPQPVLRQSITITRDAAAATASYQVARGALVLSFPLLFLREPGPQEGDIIISIAELQELAEAVWLVA